MAKRKRGRPRKKPEMDKTIQHGIHPRYHAPCTKCPECGSQGRPIETKPFHPLHIIEKYHQCVKDSSHWWVEVREMGAV